MRCGRVNYLLTLPTLVVGTTPTCTLPKRHQLSVRTRDRTQPTTRPPSSKVVMELLRRCPESAKARNLLGQTPISLALRTKRPDSVLLPLVSAVSECEEESGAGRESLSRTCPLHRDAASLSACQPAIAPAHRPAIAPTHQPTSPLHVLLHHRHCRTPTTWCTRGGRGEGIS